MNKSIISDIFYGKRGHHETIKGSKDYWKVMDEVSKLSDNLSERLSEEEKKLFREFIITSMGLEAETALTYFTEGLKIGLLLGKEVFEE